MSNGLSLFDQLENAVDALLADRSSVPQPSASELEPLLRIAAGLRDLPRADFLARLQSDLNTEGALMAAQIDEPVRPGFHAVTPYIVAERAPELVEFLKRAFGAEETLRVNTGGGLHIEVRVGEDMLMIGGSNLQGHKRPTGLHYFVEHVDAVYERALQAGATSLLSPVDQPYGTREAAIEDVGGNHWYISTPMKDAHGREYFGLRTVAPYLHPKGADQLIDFLKRALGAEEVELHREEEDGSVVHAKLRIADSIVELGEAHGQWQPMPTSFFIYARDPEVLYQRALHAGATVVDSMGTKPYGRGGGVLDTHGNQWHIFAPPGA